jgi:hypothetical protein
MRLKMMKKKIKKISHLKTTTMIKGVIQMIKTRRGRGSTSRFGLGDGDARGAQQLHEE